jgi:hypothetical protein
MLLVPIFVLGLVFMGCDSSTSNDNQTPNNKFDQKATIQGTVFDATTGNRIGDDTLEITLVQGTDYRSPKVLNTNPEKPFLGDYAFDNVPVTLAAEWCDEDQGDCYGSATYRIVATMTGYETFEGYIRLQTDMYDNENTLGTDGQNNDVPTMNTIYNYIGNIYLFPLGSTAPDYTIYVEYDYERVPGATVYFEYKPEDDNAVTNVTDYRICAEEALGRTLIGTTDANGMVTFSGANLVLGGKYRLSVLPVVYENVQLGLWQSATFYVGWDNNEYLVTMYDLVPGNNTDGLKIVSASNRDSNHVVKSGVLTLSFNQPVTLVDETLCGAALSGALDGGALDATGTPVTDSEVTITGSGTSTLVFTPNLSTVLGTNASGVSVTFDACYITVGDDVWTDVNAFTVPYVDGNTYNFNTVRMVP